LFAKGSTSKKRPSPHIHKVPTRNNKVSPRTFQTGLLCSLYYRSVYFYNGEAVPVFNYVSRHEDVLGSGSIAPGMLYLGTRCTGVISFTPRPLYL
jgi:hypothetical protein